MKKAILFFLIGLIFAVGLFFLVQQIKPLEKETNLITGNDTIESLKIERDSLKNVISLLQADNSVLKSHYIVTKTIYIKRTHKIETLPPDSQLLVFNGFTDNTNRLVSGSIAMIPVENLKTANILLTEGQGTKKMVAILDSIASNQDSTITSYDKLIENQFQENRVLKNQQDVLSNTICEKNKIIKKDVIKQRITYVVSGIIVVLALLI